LVVAHALPQAPQFFGSIVVSVSQPLLNETSQLAWPMLQVKEHLPLLHVPFANGAVQALKQAPQWPLSVSRSTHEVPQVVFG
jgi:hypothetical protein